MLNRSIYIFDSTLPPVSQNLVRVGSAILAPDTRPHWELIQHTEGGTAALLRRYEEYANALAQNMRKTYLSPFTIVTPHIGEAFLSLFGGVYDIFHHVTFIKKSYFCFFHPLWFQQHTAKR